MPKDLTAKDVFYALEYLGDALVRVPIRDGKAKWQMRDSGFHVKDSVASAVQASGNVVAFQDLGRSIIKWKAAA